MQNITAEKYFGYPITVKRLVEGYTRNEETGEIRCFNGKLNPRPSYQREFVYSMEDEQKVFATLHRAFPLGIMYWCDCGDGTFELIDGQQRTLSIVDIIRGQVALNIYGENKYFGDLAECEQEQILDQELLVYVCSGDVSQKLEWFSTINIAGKALKAQELRSAVYHGPFVTDAKRYFVTDADSNALANEYASFVDNAVLRQDLLEQVLFWHADKEGFEGNLDTKVKAYLREHQNDENAQPLWNYYEEVINWASNLFGQKYKKEIKRVEWGLLFNRYHEKYYSPKEIQSRVDELMKRTKLEEQNHKCAFCGGEIPDMKSAQADHIVPWSKGGRTVYENLQILCVKCNAQKSNKSEAK